MEYRTRRIGSGNKHFWKVRITSCKIPTRAADLPTSNQKGLFMKITPISPITPTKNHLKNPTKVIFRKTRTGQVIALFPELPGTSAWYADCLSYMQQGQHGPADINLHTQTKSCTRRECEPLIKELTALGYQLEIVQRLTASHLTARKKAVEGVTCKNLQ